MKLQFTEESPDRIAAFGKFYAEERAKARIFQTVEEARAAARPGQWICSVSLFDHLLFFANITLTGCKDAVQAGNIIGRWNELELIERV